MIWLFFMITAFVQALWNAGWGDSEMALLWAIISWLLAEKVIEWARETRASRPPTTPKE